MPVAITQAQPYQLPGVIPLQFIPTTGNLVRVWLTAAPRGSKLEGRLGRDTQNNRIEVFYGGTGDIWEVELDKGGGYVFTLQEYRLGAAEFRGGYANDPAAAPSQNKVGAEVSQTIHIGERLSHRLGTGTHGFADLVVYIWDDTIRQTTVALHGETTPAVLNPTTKRVEAAVYSDTVAASVAALVDLPAVDLLPSGNTLIAEMVSTIPRHFNNIGGAWHGATGAPDDINDTEIEDLPTQPKTPEGFARVARVLLQRLSLHMQNESDGRERDRHTYPDFINALIANPPPPGSSNMATAWASIADVYRAYEDHRQHGSVHAIADTVNVLTTPLDPLLVIHRDFLGAIQPVSPVAPAVANSGVTQAMQLGFLPAPR